MIEPALTKEDWERELNADEEEREQWARVYMDSRKLRSRHAVAAIALFNKDYGFTRGMVDALQAMWLKLDDEGWGDLATTTPDSPHRLAGQAIERIAALLPPEKKGA